MPNTHASSASGSSARQRGQPSNAAAQHSAHSSRATFAPGPGIRVRSQRIPTSCAQALSRWRSQMLPSACCSEIPIPEDALPSGASRYFQLPAGGQPAMTTSTNERLSRRLFPAATGLLLPVCEHVKRQVGFVAVWTTTPRPVQKAVCSRPTQLLEPVCARSSGRSADSGVIGCR
jgi:hypothetical protein